MQAPAPLPPSPERATSQGDSKALEAKSFAQRLAHAAAFGLLLAACEDKPKTDAEPVSASSAAATAMPAGSGAEDKDCCMGKNECKGKGGCAVPESNACQGKNECKGKGGCHMRDCG
jgi:hypothetical protein